MRGVSGIRKKPTGADRLPILPAEAGLTITIGEYFGEFQELQITETLQPVPLTLQSSTQDRTTIDLFLY